MKNAMSGLLIVLFLFAVSNISFSQSKNPSSPNTYENIEANYLKGLNSGNPGIQSDCAYFLGEIKSQKAVIPLMKMFRESENDGTKLVAAWSLLKIGDPRGVHLVKRTADLGECGQIRSMLYQFAKDFDLKAGENVAAK